MRGVRPRVELKLSKGGWVNFPERVQISKNYVDVLEGLHHAYNFECCASSKILRYEASNICNRTFLFSTSTCRRNVTRTTQHGWNFIYWHDRRIMCNQRSCQITITCWMFRAALLIVLGLLCPSQITLCKSHTCSGIWWLPALHTKIINIQKSNW